MENTEEKIKCYTMTLFGSTLIDSNLDNIVETLKIEIEENLEEAQMPVAFVFGIQYLTQSEIDALGEFDGF